MTDTHHDLLTLDEAAALLRAPVATLRYWRHCGIGPRSFRAGRRVLYRSSDLLAWIDQQVDAGLAHDQHPSTAAQHQSNPTTAARHRAVGPAHGMINTAGYAGQAHPSGADRGQR